MFRLLSPVFLLLLASHAGAQISVPIFSTVAQNNLISLGISAAVGTPPQNAKLSLRLDLYDTNPSFMYNGKECLDGQYDPNKSSTFVKISSEFGKDVGNDTVSFAPGIVFKNLPIASGFESGCWDFNSLLGFRFESDPRASFVRDYVKSQQNQLATLAIKKLGVDDAGTLVLGDTPSNLCANDWQYLQAKTIKEENDGGLDSDWGVRVDQISVGSFSSSIAGNATFDFGSYKIWLPSDVFYGFMRELKSHDFDTIPCNTQTIVSYKLGETTLNLTPDQYINRTSERDGKCQHYFDYFSSSTFYQFPVSLLEGNCFQLDYKQHKVGFAAYAGH